MKHEGKFIAFMALVALVLTMWDVAAHAHDDMRETSGVSEVEQCLIFCPHEPVNSTCSITCK